jgi:hypothetical protein
MSKTPTQQDTADRFFGAGADVYSWWRGMDGSWDFREEAPDGWSMTVKIDNPDGPGQRSVMVTHSVLMGAVRRIAQGTVKAGPECVENCKRFLRDPDSTDFDAGSADQVLQVATIGSVAYG